MCKKKAGNQGQTQGFTILETMIVLAAAGLILMVLLLAIPTLQRNSRNNARKQDVQAILGAVANYKLNNSGCMPNACGGNFLQSTRLGYYASTVRYIPGGSPTTTGVNVYSYGDWTTAPATVTAASNPDEVNLYNHEKCDAASQGRATRSGAGFSDVVALFALETGGGQSLQCEQF